MDFLVDILLKFGSLGISLFFAALWAMVVKFVIKKSLATALISSLIGGTISFFVQWAVVSFINMDERTTLLYGTLAFIVGAVLGLYFPIVRKK